jgi:hypothetical protein
MHRPPMNASLDPKPTTSAHAVLHAPRAESWTRPPRPTTTLAPADTKQSIQLTKAFTSRPKDTRQKRRSQPCITLLHLFGEAAGAGARASKLAIQTFCERTPAPPLRHDWRLFVSTDGSVLTDKPRGEPGIGAAVYIPANQDTGQPSVAVAIDCRYLETNHEHPLKK